MDYWFLLKSIGIILIAWLFRFIAIKNGKSVINSEKHYPGILGLAQKYDESIPPALSGKDAVRMGRIIARVGDLVFWLVLFAVLIIIVSQFEDIFVRR